MNQIVEYIVQNGLLKDFSGLQETPFTDQGSIIDLFPDLTLWGENLSVIDSINDNAVVVA